MRNTRNRLTTIVSSGVFGVLAVLVLMAFSNGANASARTQTAQPRIDLVTQTVFVSDEPAVIELRLDASTDNTIRVRIYKARTTRDEVRASYNASATSDEQPFSNFTCAIHQISQESPCSINDLGNLVIELPDHEIGEILRVNQGALVVAITLENSDGTIIDTLITHLLVLENQPQPALHIAFIADLTAPLATNADQTITLDTENLLKKAQRIAAHRQIPITVALQPETIQALTNPTLNGNADLSGDRDQSNANPLAELAALLSDRPILNAPWVELDEEGWRRSGGSSQVTEQYDYGAAVVDETLGRRPTKVTRLDKSANAQTLSLLRQNGTEAVIVAADQIAVNPNNIRGSRNSLAPLQLRDSNNVTMPAISIEQTLQRTLNHADPELGGYRVLAELVIATVNSPNGNDQAVLLDFDQIHPATLKVLLNGIAQSPNLRTATLERALRVPAAQDSVGQPYTALLQPNPAPDLSGRAADIATTKGTLDAYASMLTPSSTPITAYETLLRAAASSNLTDQQANAYTQTIFDTILVGTSNISIEPSERITLTDRRATLSLTVRNGQPIPLNVDLLFSAEKLRFVGGERTSRTLQPGDNEVTMEVETLASGDSRISVAITSPGGQLELTEGTIGIRSTALSGLGLVISAIALAVLGGWWMQTIWRVKRNRSAANVTTSGTSKPKPTKTLRRKYDRPYRYR